MTAGCQQCIEKSEPKRSPRAFSFDNIPGFNEMLHDLRLQYALRKSSSSSGDEEDLTSRPPTPPEIPPIVIKPELDNTDSDEISPSLLGPPMGANEKVTMWLFGHYFCDKAPFYKVGNRHTLL